MLKQRQKDLDFRQLVENKINRLTQDKEIYEQKYRQALKQFQDADKHNYAL
jgi:hypothetical protein